MRDQRYFESHMLSSEEEKDFKLLELLKMRQGNAVVYCATVAAVDYVHEYLEDHRIESYRYVARMRASQRREALTKFNAAKSAVLITCDTLTHEIADAHVRLVVHFNYPFSMGEYLKETSVAGNDGLPARCSLLYLKKDKRAQKRDPDDLREVTKYVQSALCRADWLAKFDDRQGPGGCQRCDNCLKAPKSQPSLEKSRIDLDAILEASM